MFTKTGVQVKKSAEGGWTYMWEVFRKGFSGSRFTVAGGGLTGRIFQCCKADFELKPG